MGKIFYIMGKSASGKDNIYKGILENASLSLKELVLYTTRPIRHGETDGKEYYFVDDTHLNKLRQEGKIIEERSYDTIHGIWTYFRTINKDIRVISTRRTDICQQPMYGVD